MGFVLKRSCQKRAPIVSSADRIYRIFFVQCVEIFVIAHINAIMIIGKNINYTARENQIQMSFEIIIPTEEISRKKCPKKKPTERAPNVLSANRIYRIFCSV